MRAGGAILGTCVHMKRDLSSCYTPYDSLADAWIHTNKIYLHPKNTYTILRIHHVFLRPAGDAILGACMNAKETNLHWKKTRAACIHRPIYTKQRITCQRAMCILCTQHVFPRPAEDAILGAGPMMISTYWYSKETDIIRTHRVILRILCRRWYARRHTYAFFFFKFKSVY